jgi:uncharacterized protein (TIGR03437 family)
MKRLLQSLTLVLLFCTAAFSQSTTISVSGTLAIGISFSFTGTATLSGAVTGSGPISVPTLTSGASGFTGNYTITLSGGTLTGVVTVPPSVLTGSGNISMTVTGGTGSYAGATGSFAALTGSASLAGTSVTLTNFTGSGTITLSGGGGGNTNTPAITEVLDAGSYTKNVAPGSVFVVKGSNLAPSGLNQASFPLPSTLAGVRITFRPASGAAVDAYMVYTCNTSDYHCTGDKTQLAAILPSTIAAGTYAVTVTTAQGTSTAFSVQVVNQKPAILTQDYSGSGLAVVQNFISQTQLDVDRFTTQTINGSTVSPAKPGQVLIAWMTGLGPLPTGTDNTASAAVDFNTTKKIRALVGGVEVTPLYAGRAPGLAGADQVNFILPANVATGCVVPFQVSVDGQLSNSTFISIAPTAAATECVYPGYTTAQLNNFDLGGSITIGGFSLSQIQETVPQIGTVKVNSIGGGFTKITGFQLSTASSGQTNPVATNSCQVIQVKGTQTEIANPINTTMLDAGTVTLTGPAGSNLTNAAVPKDAKTNAYALSLGFEGAGLPSIPGQINATLVAGQYKLAGAGGKDVGVFNATANLSAPLTITGGLPATVVRANGLPLAWTGGGANDVVMILGYAGTTSGTGTNAVIDATEFVCTTTAGANGFTVPASILTQLPAVSSTSATGATFLEVVSYNSSTFTAPLTAGGAIDAGVFATVLGIGALPSWQ